LKFFTLWCTNASVVNDHGPFLEKRLEHLDFSRLRRRLIIL
jgi:hypothetical protein